MFKTVLAVCALVLFTTSANAQDFRFADIPWGSTGAAVVAALEAQSLKVSPKDKDGDYVFEGRLLGERAVGLAFMSNDKLVKVTVSFLVEDHKARSFYGQMKEILTVKYGGPQNDYNFFVKPYYDGDGYEDQAIRLGKAEFASFWGPSSQLALQITDTLNVKVGYESNDWGIESKKRKATATRVF